MSTLTRLGTSRGTQLPGGALRPRSLLQRPLFDALARLKHRRLTRLSDIELSLTVRNGHPRSGHPVRSLPHVAAFAERVAPGSGARHLQRIARDMLEGRIVGCTSRGDRGDAIVLAATALALSGRPAHVIALSGARATQLYEAAFPVFELMKLDAALLGDTLDLTSDGSEYLADAVFASAGRLAQDQFRNEIAHSGNIAGMRRAVRRLAASSQDPAIHMPERRSAIVDDADLVMIEAVSPVKIAEGADREVGRAYADQAFQIITALERRRHYTVDPFSGRIILTDEGDARLETFGLYFGGAWDDIAWREKTTLAALTVRDTFLADTHYSTDAGAVTFANQRPPSAEQPSIEDLISAKEMLSSGVRAVHLSDTQRLFKSYDSLAGVAHSVENLAKDFKALYDLRVVREPRNPNPDPPSLFSVRDTLVMKLKADVRLSPGDVVWAPFEDDAKDAPWANEDVTVVIGYSIFDLGEHPSRVIQIGAAQTSWERRLRNEFPNAKVLAYASAEDGLFAPLERTETSLDRFARFPDTAHYRSACASAFSAATRARKRHLQSDQFFDRILSFVRS